MGSEFFSQSSTALHIAVLWLLQQINDSKKAWKFLSVYEWKTIHDPKWILILVG